jgi:hypothetical protein
LCGDFGGLQYVLLLLGNLIVAQFSETSFNIKAISKLYNVKTQDDQFIKSQTKKKKVWKK